MFLPRHSVSLVLLLGVSAAAACSPATETPGPGGSGGQGGASAGSGGGGRGGSNAGSGGNSAGNTGGSGGNSAAGGSGGATGGNGGAGGSGGASVTGGWGTGGGAAGGSGGSSGGTGGSGTDTKPAEAGGDSGTPPVGGMPSADPVPSAACAGGAMMPGPNGNQALMDRGKNRSFIIRMPTGYDGKKAFPIFFGFHGAGGGASGFETGAFGGVSRMLTEKAIRVFPQAFGGNTWSRDENDDVLYMDAVMEWLKTRVCYDSARVFGGGQSSGAYFSHRWACDRGTVVRAVTTNSGGQRRERPLDCKSPVSAWVSTGAADNPGHVMGTRQARDVWAKLAGCTTMGPMPTMPSPCVAMQGCRPGYKVHYCEHGGGHAMPGYAPAGMVNFLFGPDKP
jgi:poly(3-hydroxybutyrate) depolymerase